MSNYEQGSGHASSYYGSQAQANPQLTSLISKLTKENARLKQELADCESRNAVLEKGHDKLRAALEAQHE